MIPICKNNSYIEYYKISNGYLFEKDANVDYNNYDLIVTGYQEKIYCIKW